MALTLNSRAQSRGIVTQRISPCLCVLSEIYKMLYSYYVVVKQDVIQLLCCRKILASFDPGLEKGTKEEKGWGRVPPSIHV